MIADQVKAGIHRGGAETRRKTRLWKTFNHKGHEGTQRKGEADHAPSPLQQAQK